MSMRQLLKRIERLEARIPEPPSGEELTARARYKQLQEKIDSAPVPEDLFGLKYSFSNETPPGPLTPEEQAEYDELSVRFDPLARVFVEWRKK